MERTGKLILVLALVLFTAGQVFANGGSDSEAADGVKEVRVAVSLATQASQWWTVYANMVESAIAAVNAEGEYKITYNLVHNDNAAVQVDTVNDQLIDQPDIMIMAPIDMATSVAAVDACYAADVPVVTCCRASNSENVTAGRLFNEAQFGINQVDKIVEDFPDGANIVYLFGPNEASYAIAQYKEGFLPSIKNNSSINVLEVFENKQDTQDVGLMLADDALLKFEDVDAFAATNDGLAIGAVQAIKAAGRDDVKVYGSSALPQGMVAIRDGNMSFTNMKSQAVMADTVVKLALDVYAGNSYEQFGLVDPVVITAENVKTVRDATFGGTIADPATFDFDKYAAK